MAYQPKSYKKFVATAATATLVASAIVPVALANEATVAFSDVSPNYKDAVDYLVSENLSNGLTETEFGIDENIKRGDAAIILAKALGIQDDAEAADSGFSDVPTRASLAINSLKAAGVIKGKTATRFGFEDNLTRGEVSLILANVKAYNYAGDVSKLKFTDVIGTRYASAVAGMVEAGITQGKTATSFGTSDAIKRGDFAMFIYKAEGSPALKANVDTLDINAEGNEFTLVFNRAVPADADIKWLADNYSITINGNAATEAQLNSLNLAVKSLSADGKTLVVSHTDLDELKLTGTSVELAIGGAKDTYTFEVVVAPKVESVTAINAKQLEVKFNKAITSSSALDTDGTLKPGVVEVTTISGTYAMVDGTSAASLSADGKTLTISTAPSFGGTFNGQYVVKTIEDTLKTTDGQFVPAYTSGVFTAQDTVSPVISSVLKLDSSNVRVNFSEPLSSAGSWAFTFADGSTAAVTLNADNISKGYVDLTIDPSITAGKVISATVLGAADFANNLISPNPTTFTFSKGALDGTAPTVTSVTPNGLNKFELKFSEVVQGLTVSDILVDGVARTTDLAPLGGPLAGTEAIITQDATDKTKYTVEIAPFTTAGIHSVGLVANAVSDLSGELSASYSKVVDFKADGVAPKLVKSEVKTESGVEYLYLTFDESVTEGDVSTLAASEVKNFVTVNGTVNLTALAPVANTDNKQHVVALSAITFDPAGVAGPAVISNSATYTVALTGFTDSSSNPLASTSISFTRAADTDLTKPAVVLTDGDLAPYTVNNGVNVINNDTLQVTFDKALDGATATNKLNYTVNGLAVKSATLLPNNVVELKLEANTNSLTGVRNVAISGVKSASGVLMNSFTASEYFVENVKPTFTAAVTQNNEITLTFSENVENLTSDAAADLEVNIDGVDVTSFTPPVLVTETGTDGTKTYKLVLSRALTAGEYAKTITVTPAATNDVADVNGNLLSFTSVNVTK